MDLESIWYCLVYSSSSNWISINVLFHPGCCICRKWHAAFIETLTNAMLEEDTSGGVKGYSMACSFKLLLMARQAHCSVYNLFVQKLARSRAGFIYCTSICGLYLVIYAAWSHIYPQYTNILSPIIGVRLATYCCGIKFCMAWNQSFSCSLRSSSCWAQWKTAIFFPRRLVCLLLAIRLFNQRFL